MSYEIKSVACRKSFTDTLLELGRQDKNIVAVTTDARGSVTLTDFAKQLPEQFVECGIAEQDAVGIAAGLASCGKKVFVCGPACFYVARSLEQVKVDVAYSGQPVKILGVSGGVAYGALGATHHSLHDIAVLRTFPGMQVVLPCDARQTRKLVEQLVDYPHPVYVRVGRNAVPDVYTDDAFDFEIGKSIQLQDGNDLTIIGTGETVFHRAAKETGRILTVEEHSMYGGLGGIVAETVAQNCPVPMRILGIPDENAVHGKPLEIFHHYKLDADGIYETALGLVKGI